MKDSDDNKKYRIFVLGAGFSKLAGFPLASELWTEISNRAKHLSGRAVFFNDDLEEYIKYKHECEDMDVSKDAIDFEDFMRVLDIEHFLGLRGSDTWSVEGNESTVVVKTLIGKILSELTPSTENIPRLYLEFAKKLQPNDIILTFNYDILLEQTLDAIGMPYRLFPDRYESLTEHGAIVDDSKEEVVILKLHGSINWFDRSSYTHREEDFRRHGIAEGPNHPVFCTKEELGVKKILEGPRHSDDPLMQMYSVSDIKTLYRKRIMFLATPWILAPSTVKILYAGKIKDFWDGMGQAGVLNFGLTIIGYSLPPQDEYARQAIYKLVTNYQTNYWDKEVFGKRKSPLVIVNKCTDENSLKCLKSNYRFVDWDRAILYKDGFDNSSLNLIFNSV